MTEYNRKYGDRPIGRYTNGGGYYPDFEFWSFFRQDEREEQPQIAAEILRRLNPTPRFQCVTGAQEPLVPRSDMVLPTAAPADIIDIADLLRRFDATPPLPRDIYAIFKITPPEAQPWHVGWEEARGFTRQHFSIERGLAAILALHRPCLAGSANRTHIHIFVLARRLTAHGFAGHAYPLCGNDGHTDAWNAWCAWRK